MHTKCTGMQRIMNGFMRYRYHLRGSLLKTFESVGEAPNPSSIVITCIDSRIVASRIMQADPGDIFMARNPGNLVPNYKVLDPKTERAEAAALELAFVYNKVDSIVVCGHSDCKAMNLVYENRKEANKIFNNKKDGVLKSWLMSNSMPTIEKFNKLQTSNFNQNLTFNITDNIKFDAFIDPQNNFGPNDKFSLLNTLVQLENLKHFSFLKGPLEKREVKAYAMWLNIYNGDIYIFSFKDKSFVRLDEDNHENISKSISF